MSPSKSTLTLNFPLFVSLSLFKKIAKPLAPPPISSLQDVALPRTCPDPMLPPSPATSHHGTLSVLTPADVSNVCKPTTTSLHSPAKRRQTSHQCRFHSHQWLKNQPPVIASCWTANKPPRPLLRSATTVTSEATGH
ncbi:hypothetical protein FXO38_06506 [Capsicum annuum]|nr:hypothetical protein FXO38_06506 [Capsicum annuum]KAF3682756.1 hypothetical protein FXO37_02175 [Capsicum annuum]